MTTANGTRPRVHKPNDLAISSEITDFNAQISAVNIHSHCSKTVGQEFLLETLGVSIRNSWGSILNLSGQIDLAITLETSHYLFSIALIDTLLKILTLEMLNCSKINVYTNI